MNCGYFLNSNRHNGGASSHTFETRRWFAIDPWRVNEKPDKDRAKIMRANGREPRRAHRAFMVR
jgi:hypothetical protein